MPRRNPRRLLLFISLAAALTSAAAIPAAAQFGQRPGVERGQIGSNRDAYERGYREGMQRGEQDARRGRPYDLSRDDAYRAGDRGYNRRDGSREAYRDSYRGGFEEGYRTGFTRIRDARFGQRGNNRGARVLTPRGGRGYYEPAFGRGYSDGFEKGLEDGRDGDRYDPVRHRDYRDGDQGYSGSYGSRDAYRNNYRAGFRQGYEEGYRDGARYRR